MINIIWLPQVTDTRLVCAFYEVLIHFWCTTFTGRVHVCMYARLEFILGKGNDTSLVFAFSGVLINVECVPFTGY